MKTTIDIPDKLLSDAIRFTKAKTKKDAILTVLEDFIRRQKVAALASTFGTWDMASNAEIETADVAQSKLTKRAKK
ncbi:MAG: type II toxin-antitoxin system VapB family antitoxin [Akkermansiaceae bacterium]|jgi:Arc/MetJ family transcription regulator|tara:strand:+ start:18522 stop:18749 length:228 start_codon:yes stop_codon:yes gene_type:complete